MLFGTAVKLGGKITLSMHEQYSKQLLAIVVFVHFDKSKVIFTEAGEACSAVSMPPARPEDLVPVISPVIWRMSPFSRLGIAAAASDALTRTTLANMPVEATIQFFVTPPSTCGVTSNLPASSGTLVSVTPSASWRTWRSELYRLGVILAMGSLPVSFPSIYNEGYAI